MSNFDEDVATMTFWQDARMYVIYGLVDPRDGLVRYVGMTKDLPNRLMGHVTSRNEVPNTKNWIADLDVEGLLPIVRIFGNVRGLHECGEVERYWIRKLYVDGHPLANRQGLFGARTGELVKQVQTMLDAK